MSHRRAITAIGVALCLFLGAAGPVAAQSGETASPGFEVDSSQPIEVVSDSLEVFQRENKAVFTGNVDALQGDIRLRTTRLTVFYEGDPQGETGSEITELLAEGDVIVTSQTQRATGARARYDVAAETIYMTGDVVLSQDENVIRGQELTIDLASGRSKLSGGRVRSVFSVPERDEPATQ